MPVLAEIVAAPALAAVAAIVASQQPPPAGKDACRPPAARVTIRLESANLARPPADAPACEPAPQSPARSAVANPSERKAQQP